MELLLLLLLAEVRLLEAFFVAVFLLAEVFLVPFLAVLEDWEVEGLKMLLTLSEMLLTLSETIDQMVSVSCFLLLVLLEDAFLLATEAFFAEAAAFLLEAAFLVFLFFIAVLLMLEVFLFFSAALLMPDVFLFLPAAEDFLPTLLA